MSATIDKAALLVELNGQTYYVALPIDRLRMLVQLAESLSDNGRLQVVKAPDSVKLTEWKET
jgi:hypothetical protein